VKKTYSEARDIPQKPWEYVAGELDLSESDLELLRALYRGEIAYLDEQLHQLKSVLQRHDEWHNTIFIVVGDHGENIGDHGLMDHQYSVHDPVIHVPLIIHGPEFNGRGASNRLVQTIDLYPTILDAAGVSIPPHTQGRSFHPNSSADARSKAISEYLSPQPTIQNLSKQTGVREEKLKHFGRSLRAIRTNDFKFIRGSDGTIELYEAGEIENEEHEISKENNKICTRLENELDSWIESFDHANQSDNNNEMSQSTQQRLEDLGYI
jgi:arylsulfatase A-like enzyme